MGLINSIDSRLVFKNAKDYLRKKAVRKYGANKTQQDAAMRQAILSQSFLRFEVVLDEAATQYLFNVVITQQSGSGVQYPTEKRLQLQDMFFCSHMGMFVTVNETSTGVPLAVIRNNLMTFPNAALDGGAYEGGKLKTLWNSQLSLTVDGRVICPAWDTFRHYYAPQTQEPSVSVPFTQPHPDDQIDGSQDGFYPVEPLWVLNGAKNNQFQLNLPYAMTGFNLAGYQMRVVVIMRGVLAQNSTTIANN